ncbi:MAG TPA: helix-turn-helix domain-containing protein [Pirellulaceae bacterium]|nr:helix-turn-helix domain-containing protein [Pirellulaceae bacterium]HMO91207.1 helix-turn-helix domain-containing protein [Pirellulaceae bacterium]HMP71599.1 helix-turn-helix domain-containing protein [Pirellulaceae bacterium]
MKQTQPGSSDPVIQQLHNSSNNGNAETNRLLLTEAQAATALGVSRRTLFSLRREGKIPFVRIGKCIRYSVEALRDWITSQNENPKPNLPQ